MYGILYIYTYYLILCLNRPVFSIFFLSSKKELVYVCPSVRPSVQARQTWPNSGGGGVAEGQPRIDKGGVAIIFYALKI